MTLDFVSNTGQLLTNSEFKRRLRLLAFIKNLFGVAKCCYYYLGQLYCLRHLRRWTVYHFKTPTSRYRRNRHCTNSAPLASSLLSLLLQPIITIPLKTRKLRNLLYYYTSAANNARPPTKPV